jgi:hypothetical protein
MSDPRQSGPGIDRASISSLITEAESKPVEFNPVERSAFIRKSVQQVKAMLAGGHDAETIKSVFPEFAEQFPKLLDMLLMPNFDEKSLALMINMLDKMGAGKTTQHLASVAVGEHLMNAYVKPQLDENQARPQ